MKPSGVSQLPKDVLELMVNDLSSQDLINLCASDARPDFKHLCNDNNFWVRRWKKDFSIIMSSPFYNHYEAKTKYLELFSNISRGAEKMVNDVLHDIFGNFTKFLIKDYHNILYKYFYDKILASLNELVEKRNMDGEENWIPFSMVEDFGNYIPDILQNSDVYDEYYSDILIKIEYIIREINDKLKLFKVITPDFPPSPVL